MQDRHTGPAGYQDPLISIQEGTLAIRRYYFPTGAKRIRLAAITGVEQYPMGKATGRWRAWGSGDLIHWFNLDPSRRHKRQAFIIDLGRRAKPVVTPTTRTPSAPPWRPPGSRSRAGILVGQDGDRPQATSSAGGRGAARSCRVRFAGEHQSHADRPHPGADGDASAMNPDGSAVTRLTHAGSEEQEPALTRCKGACP